MLSKARQEYILIKQVSLDKSDTLPPPSFHQSLGGGQDCGGGRPPPS